MPNVFVGGDSSQKEFRTLQDGKGDPRSATGVAQCVESHRRTRIALAHNMDDSTASSLVKDLKGPVSHGG